MKMILRGVSFLFFSICIIYVKSDTSSDDESYQNTFHTKLIQVMERVSNKLQIIADNTNGDRIHGTIFDELNKLKEDNEHLKVDLELLQNTTNKENEQLKVDLEVLQNTTNKENEQLKVDLEVLQNTTNTMLMNHTGFMNLLHLIIGNISSISVSQENMQEQLTRSLSNIEEKIKKQERFTNSTFETLTSDVESLNTSSYKNVSDTPRQQAKDCADVKMALLQNGVYKINVPGAGEVKVFCNFIGGGWTVFQRRKNGKTDFFRDWSDYENGFGDPSDEYWLGNKYLYHLTKGRNCQLKINLINLDNITGYALYTNFYIGSDYDGYRLNIGSYSGNASRDSLRYHNGQMFSTRDRDNDKWSGNCAVFWTGAWWYDDCHRSNLNGNYSVRSDQGVRWYGYPSSDFMKDTIMQVKCN